MNNPKMASGHGYGRSLRYLCGLVLLCFTLGVSAADDRSRDASDQGSAKDETPKCFHGCERWGKVCNTDPRGVYKCRRICEKFGEICE